MDRRAFISVLGGAVLAVPLAAEAQPGLGVPRIGYLSINLASEISVRAAFLQGLRDLGYVEGKSFVIEYRDAQGKPERSPPDRAFSNMTRARERLPWATPVFNTQARRLVDLASRHRLPTVFSLRDYVDAGGLISFGPDRRDLFRRVAIYVDKILKGASPGDLPVEQPTKFELIINLRTARALRLNRSHPPCSSEPIR
jgi:ABC transporter substrate binding protein